MNEIPSGFRQIRATATAASESRQSPAHVTYYGTLALSRDAYAMWRLTESRANVGVNSETREIAYIPARDGEVYVGCAPSVKGRAIACLAALRALGLGSIPLLSGWNETAQEYQSHRLWVPIRVESGSLIVGPLPARWPDLGISSKRRPLTAAERTTAEQDTAVVESLFRRPAATREDIEAFTELMAAANAWCEYVQNRHSPYPPSLQESQLWKALQAYAELDPLHVEDLAEAARPLLRQYLDRPDWQPKDGS